MQKIGEKLWSYKIANKENTIFEEILVLVLIYP